MRYLVTRYIGGELTTYSVDNWEHVSCLIATEKIVSWSRVTV